MARPPIYYLETGDPSSAMAESTTQAASVETALDYVEGIVSDTAGFGIATYANASARDLDITAPAPGYLSRVLTERFPREWNGSAWVPFGTGLFPIIPASVSGTGVTSNSTGLISYSTASSVAVNGCFSSDFRSYLVRVNPSTISTSAYLQLQLRLVGVNAVATNYHFGSVFNAGATANTNNQSSVASWFISPIASTAVNGDFVMNSPNLSVPTFGSAEAATGTTGIAGASTRYYHSLSTAYDGFALSPTSGTTSGSLRIFGYNGT